MAETSYNVGRAELLRGNIDLVNDTLKALLLTGTVTINKDHATVAAVVAANTEASDPSYGRQTLGTKTVTQNDTDDRADFDAATIDYGSLDNETPAAMLLYKEVTNDADSIPLGIYDTGFGAAANGAGYTVATPNDLLRLS